MSSVAAYGAERLSAKEDRAQSRIFIHIAFITCLCLQRFGFMIGDSALFLSLPVFALMIFWAYMTGFGELRPNIAGLYALFAAVALTSTLIALLVPDTRFGTSITSLGSILVSYILLTVGPGSRFDRSQVLPIFMVYVRVCAALGIAQYFAQFAGFQAFSFMKLFPALEPVLVERLFNHAPIMGYGSTIMRSNGFFLIEPSTFSQILALGFAIDFFIMRRLKWLPLYLVAYLFSNAGTGLLVLGLGLTIYALVDWRKLGRLAGFFVLASVFLVAATFLFPDQIASIADRADEIGSSRSSGYIRYLAQFDLIARYGGEARALIGWGPGAMERAEGFLRGSGNPSLKLFIDYGLIGLMMFWTFLVSAMWRRDIVLVPIMLLVQFQLGGGSLLFSPLLVLISMLCIWSGRNQAPFAAFRQGSDLNQANTLPPIRTPATITPRIVK